MASTTLKAIIDRFQAVLEGGDVNLKKTTDEFTFDREPNLMVDDVYRIEDLGLIESTSITNSVDVRVDELGIWVARKGQFDTQAVRETLETDLVTIERKIVADGPSNDYHATITSREIQRPDESDVLTARLGVAVDYDFSLV